MNEIPSYPKIPYYDRNTPSKPCVAFEKYDGTCVAWHWNREKGFDGVYTRRRLIESDDPDFKDVAPLFQELQTDLFDAISKYSDANGIAVYAEYFGSRSFAGLHHPKDSKELRIFDVWVSGIGLLEPNEFLQNFKALPLAKTIYRGKITGKFVDAVRTGQYPLVEGVVCKGGINGQVWTCKIKTATWLQSLEDSFKNQKSWIATDQIERDLQDELGTSPNN